MKIYCDMRLLKCVKTIVIIIINTNKIIIETIMVTFLIAINNLTAIFSKKFQKYQHILALRLKQNNNQIKFFYPLMRHIIT